MSEYQQLVLGIYPNAKGYGYALFNQKGELYDYGSPLISPVSNQKCLKRIRAYLEERRPTTLVLRDESARRFRGKDRTRKLLADIKRIAQDLDIHVFCYSRIPLQGKK